jgi:hypothetical protein
MKQSSSRAGLGTYAATGTYVTPDLYNAKRGIGMLNHNFAGVILLGKSHEYTSCGFVAEGSCQGHSLAGLWWWRVEGLG